MYTCISLFKRNIAFMACIHIYIQYTYKYKCNLWESVKELQLLCERIDVKGVFALRKLSFCWKVFTRDSITSRYCEARISYGNSVCPSVCLNVTTRYRIKTTWDRDSRFSPYDSLESLVANEVIWCHWVRTFSSNEAIKEGYRPKNRYFTTIGSSNTADGLSGGTNIDYLKRPWSPK